jgi:hypothetical protein
MKVGIAKKWVRALRSGEYKQGRGKLENIERGKNSSYCCLGVLCKIMNTRRRVAINPSFTYASFGEKGEATASVLPTSVVRLTGMHSKDGVLMTKRQRLSGGRHREATILDLVALNDNAAYRYTFDEIADCIDAMIYGGIIDEL